MTINAVVFDLESVPNFFSYYGVDLNSDAEFYFEISDWRNDAAAFHAHLQWLAANDWYMIGFNNIGYDYNLVHAFYAEPVRFTAADFYRITASIIGSYDRFGQTVRPDDRFIKQIDLYKVHHFDNKSKSQSLKGLEVNMRSDNVLESSVPFGAPMSEHQRPEMIFYNGHDTKDTKRFALISMSMLEFRLKMAQTLRGDVMNFNDTKIGKELVAQRLGDSVCYTYEGRKRVPRQSVRDMVSLNECIFPYIRFEHPEFQRIHNWFLHQRIAGVKGEFDDVNCTVKGMEFVYGIGGLHGSVKRSYFESDADWTIIDDDVASLYPSIAIVNRMFPEHLGAHFIEVYTGLKTERFQHKKGTAENNGLKLALNGVFGDSKNEYSVFFDLKYFLGTTVNGQLLLSMFAEQLMSIPTLTLIQINTDGVTYRVHRSFEWLVDRVRTEWQRFTCLELEQARYSRMWVRDVNNYVAETEGSGKLKMKGAYWAPRNDHWHEDILFDARNPGPPAYHKDFSACIIARAAVEYMTKRTDIETSVRSSTEPFDFMLSEKMKGGAKLYIGETQQQKVTRYYVARNGEPMQKVMLPKYGNRVGQFVQARGVSDEAYEAWQSTHGNIHNPAIHTKNRSTYKPERVSNLNAGMMVRECNDVRSFDWSNVNFEWYISESRKLVI